MAEHRRASKDNGKILLDLYDFEDKVCGQFRTPQPLLDMKFF